MIGDEKTFFSHKCPPSKAQSILPGIPPTKPPSARNRWLNHLFPTNYMNKPRHSKAPPANPDPHLHCGIRGTSLSGSSETSRKIERTAFHCDILTSTCSLGVRDHTLHSRFVNQTGKVAHETQHAKVIKTAHARAHFLDAILSQSIGNVVDSVHALYVMQRKLYYRWILF